MASNAARRAAKNKRRADRRRGERGPTPPRSSWDHDGVDEPWFEPSFEAGDRPFTLDPVALAVDALRAAAARRAAGEPEATALRELPPLWEASWEAFSAATDQLLAHLITVLHEAYWVPTDVVEVARRRLEARARTVLVDAVRQAGSASASIRRDPLWAAELATHGPSPWRSTRSVFAQRVSLERWERSEAVRAAVQILAETASWPVMSPLGAHGGERAETSADAAMLTKVRALLAKAESTMFEAEAEAYTAKAQSLMARHAIDQALLEHQPSTVTSVARMWIDAPYVVAKSMLVDSVARANRCRTVLTEKLGFCTVVGETTDVRAVVLLVTSLQVQAVRALARLGPPRRGPGAPSTQAFRQSFLVAFAGRIGERLTEVAEAEVATVDEQAPGRAERLLPVLAARSRAADARFEQLFPTLTTRGVPASSAEGLQAGRTAADLAQLAYGESLTSTTTG